MRACVRKSAGIGCVSEVNEREGTESSFKNRRKLYSKKNKKI